jgi:hypothetical protein
MLSLQLLNSGNQCGPLNGMITNHKNQRDAYELPGSIRHPGENVFFRSWIELLAPDVPMSTI